MTEASLIVGILIVGTGTLLVGVVTLIVGILALRSVRRSVGLAENRLEYLREEQDRLAFLREERQTLVEELEQERQGRLEAQPKADHLERERKEFPEAQQEGPQLGQERTMEPPQEVSDPSSTTGAAAEENTDGIRNTGTEGRGSEAQDWTCIGSVDCLRLRTVRGKESSATNEPGLPTGVSPRSYPAG